MLFFLRLVYVLRGLMLCNVLPQVTKTRMCVCMCVTVRVSMWKKHTSSHTQDTAPYFPWENTEGERVVVVTLSNIHMAVVLAEVKGCKYAHEGKKILLFLSFYSEINCWSFHIPYQWKQQELQRISIWVLHPTATSFSAFCSYLFVCAFSICIFKKN